jgi:hypothetical protein
MALATPNLESDLPTLPSPLKTFDEADVIPLQILTMDGSRFNDLNSVRAPSTLYLDSVDKDDDYIEALQSDVDDPLQKYFDDAQKPVDSHLPSHTILSHEVTKTMVSLNGTVSRWVPKELHLTSNTTWLTQSSNPLSTKSWTSISMT